VLNDADAFAALLNDGPLAGQPVLTISVPAVEEPAFAVACPVEAMDAAWRHARAIVGETGRWPVLHAFGMPNPFTRWPVWGGPESGRDLIADSLTTASAAALSHLAGRDVGPFGEVGLEDELRLTESLFGVATLADEVPRHYQLGTRATIDRWLLGWELEHIGAEAIRAKLVDSEHSPHPWHEPPSSEGPYLVFPPTAHGYEVPALISFYFMSDPAGAVRLVALMRDWERIYGAELVLHYGTMMGFYVERPPVDADAAWDIAYQHSRVAPGTIHDQWISVRHHAVMLMTERRWFLHERP
jgi:hypothetical protein